MRETAGRFVKLPAVLLYNEKMLAAEESKNLLTHIWLRMRGDKLPPFIIQSSMVKFPPVRNNDEKISPTYFPHSRINGL